MKSEFIEKVAISVVAALIVWQITSTASQVRELSARMAVVSDRLGLPVTEHRPFIGGARQFGFPALLPDTRKEPLYAPPKNP